MIAVALFIIAAICKGVCDVLYFRFERSIFAAKTSKWWNPAVSWELKWKEVGTGEEQKERFPGSSTVFVWITDAWHYFNMIQYSCFTLAVVFYAPMFKWWIDLIILKAVFSIVFEIFFRWVFIKSE